MEELPLAIAKLLVAKASNDSLTTYPQLAKAVGWYNETGQGLGAPLSVVLKFCQSGNFPILTSIVCATGTSSPSQRGLAAMRDLLGRDLDVHAEQKAVFKYDWTSIDVFELKPSKERADFKNFYGHITQKSFPENNLLAGLFDSKDIARINRLALERPILIGHFCQPENFSASVSGNAPISNGARLIGITQIGSGHHAHGNYSNPPIEDVSGPTFELKRAWRIMRPPLAISTLVDHKPARDLPLDQWFKLSDREVGEILQHDMVELKLNGQREPVSPYIPPEPAIHTYMVICRSEQFRDNGSAPIGSLLVKIGVTNDKERRLQELNANHIAVIFGINFQKYAEGTWPIQAMALEAERRAHEWCHINGVHASGEYFYLHEKQLNQAAAFVFNS